VPSSSLTASDGSPSAADASRNSRRQCHLNATVFGGENRRVGARAVASDRQTLVMK